MKKVKLEGFNIIGIAIRTCNLEGKAAKDIPKLWQQFMAENRIETIPNKIDTTIYSVYTAYESDYKGAYTAILGCKVHNLNSIPKGMIGKLFEGGSYLKFSIHGNLSHNLVINEWQNIWQSNLNRSYTADFEVYDERSKDTINAEVDIFVAVD